MPATEAKRYWTKDEIIQLLVSNGAETEVDKSKDPKMAEILAAIAMVEGSRYTHPGVADFYETGDVKLSHEQEKPGFTWGPSVSFFQLRTVFEETGKGTHRDREWIMSDANNAAKTAIMLAKSKRSYEHWTVFRNGRYAAYLQEYAKFAPGPDEYIVVGGDTLEKVDAANGLPKGYMRMYNKDPWLLINMKLKFPFVKVTPESTMPLKEAMTIYGGWENPDDKDATFAAFFAGLLTSESELAGGVEYRIWKDPKIAPIETPK